LPISYPERRSDVVGGRPLVEPGRPDDAMPPRRLLLLVRVLFLLESSLYSAVTPILPHYADSMGASKSQIGILAAAYTAGLIPGALLGGWLAARAGVRRTTVIGLLIFASALTAFGFASTLPWLDGLRVAQGVASGCIWGGALTWVIAATPTSRRGQVLGSVLAAAIFGTLVGPVLGTIAVAVGGRVLFSVVAGLSLVLAGWVMRSPEPQRQPSVERPPLRRLLATRGLLLGGWLVMLDAMTIGATNTLIPLRLASFGAHAVVIGGTFLCASALSTVVSPLTGRLSDRRGAVLPMGVGLAGAAVVLSLVPLPGSALPLALLVVILMGCCVTGFGIPAAWLLTDATERAGLAVAVGTTLFNLAFAGGETIGAPLAAGLSQLTSDAVPLLGLAAVMLASLGLVVRGRSRLPHRDQPDPTDVSPDVPAAQPVSGLEGSHHP
jgi:MFS family permease